MQRFRRSDAKRSNGPASTDSSDSSDHFDLPPVSDFRTSLILPDLSRRFTLLRSTGDPSLAENLKTRLADQRARGAEYQVTEEEEDMIFETLGFRSKTSSTASKSQESIPAPAGPRKPNGSHSPAKSPKRHSNNLFGSNRFRDYSYMRSVAQGRNSTSTTQTHSVASEAPTHDNTISQAVSDEPSEVRSAPLIPPAPYGDQPPLSVAEYRLSQTLGASGFKRASIALDEAIREMEEEAEDEIVMPRSAPISRSSFDQPVAPVRNHHEGAPTAETSGFAISSDRKHSVDLDERRISPIPSRTLPGYIPGMPRPMTPRDNMDSDEIRSMSTTPRATSPNSDPSRRPISPPSLVANLLWQDSSGSSPRQPTRPLSPPGSAPMFLSRSANGRFTPEDSRTDGFTSEFEFPPGNVSQHSRRRPASPLTSPPYQPMTVSPRPTTPSNINWSPQKYRGDGMGHNRAGSWFTDDGTSEGGQSPIDQPRNGGNRSLKSPALPDSPLIEGRSHTTLPSFSSSAYDARPASAVSGFELNSSTSNRVVRSPTPTQFTSQSPTSTSFPVSEPSPNDLSRRSSRQTAPSTPFNLNPMFPLVFSPIANSSRSSLESAGSSYHSWEGEQKDMTVSLFQGSEIKQPSWHDLSSSEQSSSNTSAGSPGSDEWEAEDIIQRYAGLKKADFTAIQEKLVGAALTKNIPIDRAPSIRRRRPSTSQSNYSLTNIRMASPPPRPISPAANNVNTPTSPSMDTFPKASIQKQNALLHAMVDSIQDHTVTSSPSSQVLDDPSNAASNDASPNSRRTRDLAQVLFGSEDDPADGMPLSTSQSPTPKFDQGSAKEPAGLSPYWGDNTVHLSRSLSSPKLPQTQEERADLAREVQRKTEAAMLALKKHPSSSNLHEGLHTSGGSVARRRISPSQISTPTLVSASTSVDTIPLPTSATPVSQPAPSKIGSRFRKLRGTLRKTTTVATDDQVLSPDPSTPPASQTIHYDPESLQVPGAPAVSSATETGRFKVPVPSPPASAGPGLKGFMARFRSKPRTESYLPSDRPSPSQLISPPLSASNTLGMVPESPRKPPPPPLVQQREHAPSPILSPPPPLSPLSSYFLQSMPQDDSPPPPPPEDETRALRQLFDAASNLGLDQQKLNDLLLVRSGSTSSRSTDWATLMSTGKETPSQEDRQKTPRPRRTSTDRSNQSASSLPRAASTKRAADFARKPREGQNASNPVVRRTIIMPSDITDVNALARKASSRRRRVSAASLSNRSIHDRVPTPPPPRSPTNRRFSTDESPPVPVLPRSFGSQGDTLLASPTSGPVDKSYDSLYEMYSEGGKMQLPPTSGMNPAPGAPPQDVSSGPGLEVLELANGEVIWNIVNNLRDDESVYMGRGSFYSEYEASDEGMKVFFKEHGRSGSSGSASSFLSPSNPQVGKQSQGSGVRPETQVYMTPSAQIGRLIENLSHGMDAGTFNFSLVNGANSSGVPNRSATSSMADSDLQWSVEERLDQMLGAMRSA